MDDGWDTMVTDIFAGSSILCGRQDAPGRLQLLLVPRSIAPLQALRIKKTQ